MISIHADGCKTITAFFSLLLLVSCAKSSLPSATSDNYISKVKYLSAIASMQLDHAQLDQLVILPQSPWGEDAPILITERYFSAAGRECITAQVQTSQITHPVVLCQYETQLWGVTRALTHTQH